MSGTQQVLNKCLLNERPNQHYGLSKLNSLNTLPCYYDNRSVLTESREDNPGQREELGGVDLLEHIEGIMGEIELDFE